MECTTVAHAPTIRPAALVAATAACGALSGLVWHSSGPAAWERPVILALQPIQLPLARAIVLLWEPLPFAVATLWLAWTVLKSKRILLACSGTVGCVAATVVTEGVLKPLVGRHHDHVGSAVFPSGHVTAAAAWAMFAWLVINPRTRSRFVLLLVPVAVSWTVISSGAHYPADAIAGLLVGGLVVYGVVTGADRLATIIATPRRHLPAAGVAPIGRAADADRTAIAA